MGFTIPNEYSSGFDFGFTAVESEESIVEKPVVNTQDIVQPVSEELALISEKVNGIYSKIDYLEEIIKAGVNGFDVDSYKELLEKEYKEKFKTLEGLIIPLLVNLMKDETKDYIKWPNRKPIIEAQIQKILAITRV